MEKIATAFLMHDLDTLSEKARIHAEYLQAMESIKANDLKLLLAQMADENSPIRKKIVRMLVTSIAIETTGYTSKAKAHVVGYTFTDEFIKVSSHSLEREVE